MKNKKKNKEYEFIVKYIDKFDQLINEACEEREKKKTDDLLNRVTMAKKKQADNKARKQKLDLEKHEEPFYERLRRADNEYQTKKRQHQIQIRQHRAHAASFKDGHCFLNLMKYSEYAKQDEIKANEIAERINKKNEA